MIGAYDRKYSWQIRMYSNATVGQHWCSVHRVKDATCLCWTMKQNSKIRNWLFLSVCVFSCTFSIQKLLYVTGTMFSSLFFLRPCKWLTFDRRWTLWYVVFIFCYLIRNDRLDVAADLLPLSAIWYWVQLTHNLRLPMLWVPSPDVYLLLTQCQSHKTMHSKFKLYKCY